MIEDPENPKYIAVDFGIMGTLGPEDQRYLGENFLAFFKRDYRRVAELHVESGWVPPDTPINAFETAIRTVCEPIFERPLKDISFGQTLMRLFQIASRFQMQVQPQLLLLQKTLLSIEGLGRSLYPDLDLWQTAKPYLENWMKKHYSPRTFFESIWNKLPLWADKLPELPEAVYDISRYWQQETHQRRFRHNFPQTSAVQLNNNQGFKKIVGIALIVGGTLAALTHEHSVWIVGVSMVIGLYCLLTV
jgi:ubiquinone biosynthesis protein